MPAYTRRSLLRLSGVGVAALAGCSGDDGPIIPEDSEETLLEGFESGTLDAWEGATEAYSVTTDAPVSEGSYSMKRNDTGWYDGGDGADAPEAWRMDLEVTPEPGDVLAADVAVNEHQDNVSFGWAFQGDGRFYMCRAYQGEDLEIYRMGEGGGHVATTEHSDDPIGEGMHTWLVEWGTGGSITCTLQTPDGSTHASVSGSDDGLGAGGIGVRRGGVIDNVRVYR